MAIVAAEHATTVPCPGGDNTCDHGAGIRALSWGEVREIVERFAALNPYDRTLVPGSILRVEPENYCNGEQHELWAYVVSAKRYALFNKTATGIAIRKYSEHGLGYLLDPRDPDDDTGEIGSLPSGCG